MPTKSLAVALIFPLHTLEALLKLLTKVSQLRLDLSAYVDMWNSHIILPYRVV